LKFYLLLLFCSLNLLAQDSKQVSSVDLVEAYYDSKATEPLYIYDSINGQIVDTLKTNVMVDSWYKIAIVSSEYGWFKIKNIQQLPSTKPNYIYENYWVRNSNFLISAKNSKEAISIYLYDQPDLESNKIHKLDRFQIMHIIETNDLWAMVRFKIGKKIINGWLNFKNQCANPLVTNNAFNK